MSTQEPNQAHIIRLANIPDLNGAGAIAAGKKTGTRCIGDFSRYRGRFRQRCVELSAGHIPDSKCVLPVDSGGSSTGETVTIDGSKVVTVTFTQNVYTINAAGSGGGSVVLSPQLPDYRYGDVVAVEAVADPGSVFQSWSGAISGDTKGQILVVDSNKSFTANFGPASYTISTTVTGGGSITLNPDKATYAYGEVVQVTATPDAEWSFAEWGLGLSGTAAAQALTVTDDTNLQAIFAPTTYALNVAWIGNGTAQKFTDKTAFTAGEIVSVAATPGVTDVDFAGWRDEASDTFFSTELATSVTITGDRSVVAVFGTPLYTVTANVVGSGTVTPTVSAYALGETATLTVTAAPGWSFTGWSGDVTGVTNPITFTVDAAKVVTATFTADTVTPDYTLTVNAVGDGTVAPTGGTYTAGATVPVTATAAAGWTFAGWSGDLSGTANPTTVTMDADKVITATFTVVPGTQADLMGSFTLQGWAGADYAVPLAVKLYPVGATTPVYEFTPTASGSGSGQFTVSSIAPGAYQVAVKHANHLQVVATLTLNAGANDHDFGTLPGADANGDNKVNFLDFSVLSSSWGTRLDDANYDARADFNGDNEINSLDFSILSSNWNTEGQNPQ